MSQPPLPAPTPQQAPALPVDYAPLLSALKERVRTAQYAALKAVNTELVGLYWDIGRMLVGRQLDAAHGTALAEQLAEDLQAEFPGIAGFSRRNIFCMREFYLLYRDDERVQQLSAQIGQTHNLVIFQRCKNPSIGIILCKEKSRTIVEYALHDANKPIGVATYQITSTRPQDLAGQLLPPEPIAALLEGIEK